MGNELLETAFEFFLRQYSRLEASAVWGRGITTETEREALYAFARRERWEDQAMFVYAWACALRYMRLYAKEA